MKPSSILRTLSFQIPRPLPSPEVSPLPIRSQFDQQVTEELDNLTSNDVTTGSIWLCQALDASINTQRITLNSILSHKNVLEEVDRVTVENYLDDNTTMLDVCNELTEKIEMIQGYLNPLMMVSHLLQGSTNSMALNRAKGMLQRCEEITRSEDKKNSCLRQLLKKRLVSDATNMTELNEILNGSTAVVSTVCSILGMALSFKSKSRLKVTQSRGTTSRWCSIQEIKKLVQEISDRQHKKHGSIMMSELEETMLLARNLRVLIENGRGNESVYGVVSEMRKSCENLEDRSKMLEQRVKRLYKHLISIRFDLMAMLSRV